MAYSIAIVEDDAQQRAYYADALRTCDFDVLEFDDRESAITAFQIRLPDLAILDIALKADVGGGYEVCRFLKQQDGFLPVIFLTSRGNELDKIYGLQLGAWDYQTKPISLEYLKARIQSLLQIRQHLSAAGASESSRVCNSNIEIGNLKLNPKSMQCFWADEEVNLTPTEFSIVSALAEADEAVSIGDMIKATQQGVVEDNTINTHILHIRKKFKKIDADFTSIKTRYGFGYHWMRE